MMERGFCNCLGKAAAAVLTAVLATAVISLLFRILILLLPLVLEAAVFVAVVWLTAAALCKIGEALRS